MNKFLSILKRIDKKSYLLFFILLLLICIIYFNKDRLNNYLNSKPLNNIVLESKYGYTSKEEIEYILSIYPFSHENKDISGFFIQDIQLILKQILKLEWIKTAYVKKIWPDIIQVKVIEYIPLAKVSDNKFISEEGIVFSFGINLDYKNKFNNLPIFISEPGDYKIMISYYNQIKDLMINNLHISKIVFRGANHWSIILSNNITLILDSINIRYTMERLIDNLDIIISSSDKEIDYIDLRYKDGVAVKFKNTK